MIISTRGKKFEFFEVDDFINFLSENNYDYNRKDAINFFIENKINKIPLSKIPFKKKKNENKPTQNKKPKVQVNKPIPQNKSKLEIFIQKSGCPKKAREYLKFSKFLMEGFKNPPQRYLEKILYYVYLPDYNYYALIIEDNEFNYFRGFNYRILDKKKGYYFDLFYIKFALLKKYFEDRVVLNINGMCHFEGFNKKVIKKIPDSPVLKIEFLENIKNNILKIF